MLTIDSLRKKYRKNLKFATNINISNCDLQIIDDFADTFNSEKCTNLILGNITADPFIVKYAEEYFIFFELMDSRVRRRGDIYVIKMKLEIDNIIFDKPQLVLSKKYHLSYPYVFLDPNDNCYYLIPENNRTGSIDLYKFVDFPAKVIFIKKLLNLPGKDTNILYHESRYYLFTYIDKTRIIYYANDLIGEWHKHPYEKIFETEIDDGRNGGYFFCFDDSLYYPQQNNLTHYGENILIMKITELSPDNYAEQEISMLPGIHHLTFVDNILVTDSKVL